MSLKNKVVIVGGGTAGLSVMRNLHRKRNDLSITIIEPKEKHYYQPLWTLVGGGIFPLSKSERSFKDFIPKNVDWIQDFVESFDPENNAISLRKGQKLNYDYLVVAPGIQLEWGKIEGLKETLGKNGVCSNYSKKHVDSLICGTKSLESLDELIEKYQIHLKNLDDLITAFKDEA